MTNNAYGDVGQEDTVSMGDIAWRDFFNPNRSLGFPSVVWQ